MLKKKAKVSSKKSGGGFKYHPRSSEAVQKRAEQQGGKFDSIFKDGIDTWRPAQGENVIRILPPTWEEHDHYGFDIWIHGFVGADKSSYLCLQKMKNAPCPICKAARDAKAAGEEDDFKALNARRQVAVWVINRDDEKSTPSLFTMSWSMDRDIAALCHNKRTGKVLLLDHPEEGYDISFSRTGKGLNTRYIGMAVDRESSPIMADEDEQEKILEYIQEKPIPDLLNFYDVDHLEKVVEGGTDERDEDLDEDEDEEEAPKKKGRAGKERVGSKRRRGAGTLDDPGPDNEEEDDEEDERPKKRRRPLEVDEVDEEEEEAPEDEKVEEPDEDEEEEEAAPPKKKPGAARTTSHRRAEPEEDEEETEDEGAEEEEEAPPPKKGSARPVRRAGFRSKSRR